ncbi:MAG: ABC transporter substrate-binding protein [Eubacteriales bacterium]|nr:ABC transporter substrate-binding protein [Eubacteriales bacterium]
MKKTLTLVLVLALIFGCVNFASAEEIKNFRNYETQAREMETFCYHYSQAAVDLNVLSNCYEHLLTNDSKGQLIPAAAKDFSSPDGGQTWVFHLKEGITWVDYKGEYMADCTSEDWLTGLEWVLNYAKNKSANTSMPIEMITGAADYYNYTKELTETEGEDAAKALGLDKFLEMVGIEAPDDYTLIYHCVDKLAYFPSVATYNCLAPLSADLIAEIGVDGYFGATYETMWYNGPYTITNYIYQNEKVLTKNESYINKDSVKLFDTVTIKMVESIDVAYEMFANGELDQIQLSASKLKTISEDENNPFHNYLVERRPTKYSYQIHLCYDKKNEDGTPDTAWNTAVANENFRLALYYGLDATNYLARTNSINPLSCQNFCYTANVVAVNSQGVDYTQLVRDEMGLQYSTEKFARYDADKAAAYKAAAIEELKAAGVELPVKMAYYISGSSTTAKETADVFANLIKTCLGDDLVVLDTKTYVSKLNTEVRDPQLASIYINGWGADFADPINFLGQETYGEDNAYYSQYYSKINNATDEKLIAEYKEFTELVNAAKAITDDTDARYAAFAKAEAYMLEHAFAIPWSYEVVWAITRVSDYSKIYTAYGNQSERYVNWETKADGYYTQAEYAEFAAK